MHFGFFRGGGGGGGGRVKGVGRVAAKIHEINILSKNLLFRKNIMIFCRIKNNKALFYFWTH